MRSRPMVGLDGIGLRSRLLLGIVHGLNQLNEDSMGDLGV
jgi:hypothetical protein